MLLIISGPVGFTGPSSHQRVQGTPGPLREASWTGPYAVTDAARYPGGSGGPGLPGAARATASTGFSGKCSACILW